MLSPTGVPPMTSAPAVPNSVATVAIRAGAHGVAAGASTPAGATGLPPVGCVTVVVGAAEADPLGAGAGAAAGAGVAAGLGAPLIVSQSAATRSTASATASSFPAPQGTRSGTSPLATEPVVAGPAVDRVDARVAGQLVVAAAAHEVVVARPAGDPRRGRRAVRDRVVEIVRVDDQQGDRAPG